MVFLTKLEACLKLRICVYGGTIYWRLINLLFTNGYSSYHLKFDSYKTTSIMNAKPLVISSACKRYFSQKIFIFFHFLFYAHKCPLASVDLLRPSRIFRVQTAFRNPQKRGEGGNMGSEGVSKIELLSLQNDQNTKGNYFTKFYGASSTKPPKKKGQKDFTGDKYIRKKRRYY